MTNARHTQLQVAFWGHWLGQKMVGSGLAN